MNISFMIVIILLTRIIHKLRKLFITFCSNSPLCPLSNRLLQNRDLSVEVKIFTIFIYRTYLKYVKQSNGFL